MDADSRVTERRARPGATGPETGRGNGRVNGRVDGRADVRVDGRATETQAAKPVAERPAAAQTRPPGNAKGPWVESAPRFGRDQNIGLPDPS